MADIIKILGQVAPASITETVLYTVPALTMTTVSSLVICNRGSIPVSFSVSLSATGAATALKDYIYFLVPLAANDTFIATVGLTLATTDVIRVYLTNANGSVSLFGVEQS
jgi:hypothetical protein